MKIYSKRPEYSSNTDCVVESTETVDVDLDNFTPSDYDENAYYTFDSLEEYREFLRRIDAD